jgi:O-methyltransferase
MAPREELHADAARAVAALRDAVEYVVRRSIPGDFVECGVWRGGSSMAIALKLQQLGVADRQLWLYDTFGRMPPPGEHDGGIPPEPLYQLNNFTNTPGLTLADVRRAMESTGYPPERVTYVEGLVEETLPRTVPAQLALLRLDTDWYESTHHELVHLSRLAPGGVLLVDDYGFFPGARKAVDEFFASAPVLLARLDHAARMAVKM